MKLKSIETILTACKKNKSWAQAKLFELFSDKMFGTCLYYTDNKADAEDLLQDGFIHIFNNIKKYKQNNLEAWMRRVFINLALMQYRRDKNRLDIVDNNIEGVDYIEDNNDSGLDKDDLMTLISKLPKQYRLVFNLYAIEGYKHREIAEMLEISEGTSKSNLARARNILQTKIKNNSI